MIGSPASTRKGKAWTGKTGNNKLPLMKENNNNKRSEVWRSEQVIYESVSARRLM